MGLKKVARPGETKPDKFAMADMALDTNGSPTPDPYRAPAFNQQSNQIAEPTPPAPSPETTITRKLTTALTEENETQMQLITRQLMERGIRPKDAQIVRLAISQLSKMKPDDLARQYNEMPAIKTGPAAKK